MIGNAKESPAYFFFANASMHKEAGIIIQANKMENLLHYMYN